MTDIKAHLLYPPHLIDHSITCGHEIIGQEGRELRRHQNKSLICGKLATVNINDHYYCKTHAALRARRMLTLLGLSNKYPSLKHGDSAIDFLLQEVAP